MNEPLLDLDHRDENEENFDTDAFNSCKDSSEL